MLLPYPKYQIGLTVLVCRRRQLCQRDVRERVQRGVPQVETRELEGGGEPDRAAADDDDGSGRGHRPCYPAPRAGGNAVDRQVSSDGP